MEPVIYDQPKVLVIYCGHKTQVKGQIAATHPARKWQVVVKYRFYYAPHGLWFEIYKYFLHDTYLSQ